MRCNNCFDCHTEYIMLYQSGQERPSLIHVWDFSTGEAELIGKIELTNDLLPDMILEPKFFCFGCNSLLTKALPLQEYDDFIKNYKGA